MTYQRKRRKRSAFMPLFLLMMLLIIGASVFCLNSCSRDLPAVSDTISADDAETPMNEEESPETPEVPEEPTSAGQEPTAPDTPDDSTGSDTLEPIDGYTTLSLTEADMEKGELILVSNQNQYAFPEDVESQLVSVMDHKNYSYRSKDYETSVLPVTVEHLNDMMDGYIASGGKDDVMVVAGFRTYDFQQGLFDRNAQKNGLENAKRFVAQPGGSEHHTGYAVDLFSVTNNDYLDYTGEYKWITDHCHEYGFILRFTSEKEDITQIGPESWHFRYIGIPHSYLVVEHDFCLEEYIDYLKEFPYDGEHLMTEVDGTSYEIYYVEGTTVPVPENYEYTVSGNNVDGFIVTVQR